MFLSLPVSALADAAVAAAITRRTAREAGLEPRRTQELALVASELATNLVRHGGGGTLELHVREEWLELCALDRGPGMADPERLWAGRGLHLPQGPTRQSLGEGGAAIRRLSDAAWASNRLGGGLEVHVCMRRRPGLGSLPFPGY